MILVRNVFQLKFGKAKEAKALWQEARPIVGRLGAGPQRAMTDVTGRFYTFVMEGTYPSLSAFEADASKVMGDAEWKKWYERFSALVDSGEREVFSLIE